MHSSLHSRGLKQLCLASMISEMSNTHADGVLASPFKILDSIPELAPSLIIERFR